MPDIIRVLVPLDSQEEQTFQVALSYASAICKKAKVRDVVLLIYTKGQLDGSNLGAFLGKANLKALNAGGVPLEGGLLLTLATAKTRLMLVRPSVLIVYYADDKLLDTADGVRGMARGFPSPLAPPAGTPAAPDRGVRPSRERTTACSRTWQGLPGFWRYCTATIRV